MNKYPPQNCSSRNSGVDALKALAVITVVGLHDKTSIFFCLCKILCSGMLSLAVVWLLGAVFLTSPTVCEWDEHLEIPIPAILKPVPLWSGKQVFSTILRPNKHGRLHVSLEIKAGNYKGPSSGYHPCMCPQDGYVIFQDSELICGNVCKNTIGGKKKGLIFMLARDHEPQDVVYAMGRMTKLTSRFLRDWGFTIGIDDVTPSEHLLETKNSIIQRNYAKVSEAIKEYGSLLLFYELDSMMETSN